jgi:Tol biopolymer transport system component
MDADGSNPRQLTDTPQPEFGTAWSPDGGQIAFVRVLGPAQTDRAIYVINADGSGEYQLAHGTRVPAWQPRGDRLG